MGLLAGVGDYGLDDLANKANASQIGAETAKAQTLAAATSVQEGKDLGYYNVATNSPTLSASSSAVADGGYYNITVGGSIGFSGANFAQGEVFIVGDRLAKLGSSWYRRPLQDATLQRVNAILPLVTDVAALKPAVDKLSPVPQLTPVIVPSTAPNLYRYFLYTSQSKDIRVWNFAQSTKSLAAVGVFIYKDSAAGTITTGARVQVLHRRDGVVGILLDRTVPASDLQRFNTAGIIGGYANYELKLELDIPKTIVSGDELFVSVYQADGITPIYAVASQAGAGEWNDASGGRYYAWLNPTSSTTLRDIPVKGSTSTTYTPLHWYDKVISLGALDSINNFLNNTGSVDYEMLAPTNVYYPNNQIGGVNARKEALGLYIQHFLRTNTNVFFNPGAGAVGLSTLFISKDNINTNTVDQEAVTFTIGGNRFLPKTVSVNRVSVNTAVMASKFPKVLWIGDSTTANMRKNGAAVGAGSLWAMSAEIAAKNAVDNGSGYKYLCVGHGNTMFSPFTYKGQSLNLKGYAAGIGGWSAPTYLSHPCRFTATPAGAWDLLGLSRTLSRAYSGSDADKLLINRMPFGLNAPAITGPAYDLLVNQSQIASQGAWTGSSSQTNAVQSWIDAQGDSPQNAFFDINKSGGNRFSITKYMERYKTLASDGTTRLTVGSTAGTKVTDATAWDVCEPTHVIICLGQNDYSFLLNYPEVVNDLFTLIGEVRSQLPNAWVGVCLTDLPGPMFPERDRSYVGKFALTDHANKFDLYKELTGRFGTLAQQVANKTFLIPTWHTMQPLSHSVVSEQTDEGTGNIVQVGIDDSVHPGYYGNRSAGNQLYGWVAYTQTL